MLSFEVSWISIQVQRELEIAERGALSERADARVEVGEAPDGLPLWLEVRRSASIVEPVLRVLAAPNVSALPSSLADALTSLDMTVQQHRRGLGLFEAPSGGLDYVSMRSIPDLLGAPLLATALGPRSPLVLEEDQRGPAIERAARTSVGALMSVDERRELSRQLERRPHLVLPLDGGAPEVACIDDAGLREERRPFLFEDLRAVPSARYHAWQRATGASSLREGVLIDEDGYRRDLDRADAVAWSLTRAALLDLIATLARDAHARHEAGRVHGDIKPHNILLLSDGPVLRDPLDLEIGALSAAGTRGWNAPEQVIASPVSPATDVYALGQLVARVLEAAVFGDERTYVIPTGAGRRERMRFFNAPDVYLDPDLIDLDDEAVAAWRALLRECFRFDVDDRLGSALELAERIEALNRAHPIPGRVGLHGLAGGLHRDPQRRGWVLRDAYAGLLAQPRLPMRA